MTPVAPATTVFISFDYDHDRDLKTLLVGQSRNTDSPFSIEDHSIKIATEGWKADAWERIKRCDVVIVICGLHTHRSVGVTAELEIARDEEVRYVLIRGRSGGMVRRPKGASWLFDDIRPWTWQELKSITAVKKSARWTSLW
jgi:MTH538 TIR-like domain (DUF1863)